MSFIFPVLACSFSTDEKSKTFKQTGRGAVKGRKKKKALISPAVKKKTVAAQRLFGVLVKLNDFPGFIKR